MRNPIIRVEIIARKIDLINLIIAECSGEVSIAMADEAKTRPAILMHLIAIAEQVNKLKEENSFEILEKFSKADLKGLNDLRNFIAHDYEGVDLDIVENAIRFGLPSLQKSISKILSNS
ncbi:MAG TPA: DUF86 domain-containing protein [Candidatus Rifleibacterium sp.]|mgnify:FL=1|nr:DUF86 domain-containing protein [Candidatus Rifleibacterium sp.]HPT47035.1 DUF86 domain-containing protein [Candidatus Rifleibacterium sp.]